MEPASPDGYIQTIWLALAQCIVYPLFGHFIFEKILIRHLIDLPHGVRMEMKQNMNTMKGIYILVYLFCVFRHGLEEVLDLLHVYILYLIMIMYFAFLILFLFVIVLQHIQLIVSIMNVTRGCVDINDTYSMMRYIHDTAVIQERKVIEMLLYDYLKCPHSVALLIASFVSDLERD